MSMPILTAVPTFTGSGTALGSTVDGLFFDGSSIDMTNSFCMTFSMPQDGIINDLSMFFSPYPDFNISQDTTITAQLFEATGPDNIFTPIANTWILTANYSTGLVTTGTFRSGNLSNLNVFAAAQTRLLLVFWPLANQSGVGNVVTGYGSGGLSITFIGP
jgi:BclB C-terminal domain-containing protein